MPRRHASGVSLAKYYLPTLSAVAHGTGPGSGMVSSLTADGRAEPRSPFDSPNGQERGHSEGSSRETSAFPTQHTYQPLWVRLACIAVDFLTQVFDQIRILPEIALFERAICRAFYAVDDPAERLCKAVAVQRQLAGLRSWRAFFDGLASQRTRMPPDLYRRPLTEPESM